MPRVRRAALIERSPRGTELLAVLTNMTTSISALNATVMVAMLNSDNPVENIMDIMGMADSEEVAVLIDTGLLWCQHAGCTNLAGPSELKLKTFVCGGRGGAECRGCTARYCCRECQAAAWKSHRVFCSHD
jgi:hypothetical protein